MLPYHPHGRVSDVSVYVIIAAGGLGRRAGGPVPKQWVTLGGQSIFARSVGACARASSVTGLVIAVPAERLGEARVQAEAAACGKAVIVVEGGARRQDSVAHAAAALPADASIVLIHDAARPFVTEPVIARVVEATQRDGGAIAALGVHDTVKLADTPGPTARIRSTLPRETVFLAQTPQGFRRDVLEHVVALGQQGGDVTDEATLAERAGYVVRLVAGDPANIKITTAEDMVLAQQRVSSARPGESRVRVGVGYDSHAFAPGRPLKLGGLLVPGVDGLAGHSDGDAVCHAVIDAILGAAGLGDVGTLFPDTDARWTGADSLDLLRQAWGRVQAAGYGLGNLDIAVVCCQPKIGRLRDAMASSLAGALDGLPSQVSVKGKTPEGTPALADALIVHAVALLVEREAAVDGA